MKLPPNWEVHPDGTPWYRRPSNGYCYQGIWRVCDYCSENFPAHPGNLGRYCSKSCSGRIAGTKQRETRSDLFERWTPEECWLAGVIWTDGTLHKHGAGYRMAVGMTDLDAIQGVVAVAGCGYRTYERPAPRKPMHRVSVGDQNAVARMAAMGMSETKMVSRPWPDLPHPASFLRGAFDGDGCVNACIHRYKKRGRSYVSKTPAFTSIMVGSVPFLEGMNAYLATQGVEPKAVQPFRNIHQVRWSRRDSERLGEIMYSEPGPFIQRKRAVFDEMWQTPTKPARRPTA